ncbi:amino acid adenylation domain-containing protein [Gordonia sp. CPCC 205515]|uniref:amino acid adenylation domain-containing protein n=1 Tax=Gordonia sp. CPCC 205515 TaxID=3140791 RepID=UPI003AF3A350
MTTTSAPTTTQQLADVLPLTPLQEAIVYHSTRPRPDGVTDPYLILADLDLTALVGPVDPARLRASIAVVLDRHAALRTSYTRRRTGQPVARVHTTVDVPLRIVDGDMDLEAMRQAERVTGISLTSAPPVRFVIAPTSGTLLVVAHHVAVDGWSLHLLLDEIVRSYRGTEHPPVRPISDFLRWLGARDTGIAAWTSALAGFESPTTVPVIGPADGSTVISHTLSADDSARLREVARSAGATLNTVFQLAWAQVLAAHNDTDDVVFGAVVSGRNPAVAGVDEMVGMLVNTIPVRVRIDPADSVRDTLARLQREQLALLEHHHTGLADIVSAMGIGELFNSLVVFESFPRGDVRPHIEDENTYPATLLVEDEPEIRVLLEHRGADAALLDQALVALTTLVTHPDTPIGRLPRTDNTGADATAAVADVAAPALPYVGVAQQFSDTAARSRRRTAVVCGDQRIGYRELDTLAGQLAAALTRRGIGPESVVALELPRRIELVAALLAVLRTGAAYLPIDPGYPADRIAFMRADARPDLILDPAAMAALRSDITADTATPAPVTPHPAAAAYLIYTSGSTGRPKGVVGTAAALANRIAWAASRWTGSTVLAKSSIAFIDGSTEILGALTAGATVVLADDVTARDAAALAGLALDTAADQVTAVPSLAHAMVDAVPALRLERWIVSGEPLPEPTAELLRRSAAEVINSYGSSEVAGDVSMGVIADDVHVGTAVPGTGMIILDRHLRPVPAGVPGEVYVTGVQVGRGYRSQSAQTASRFVAAPPNAGAAGDRMYRTGDRAVYAADGRFRLLGRSDTQVKIRGNRVELGEVESAVLAVDGVDEAAVIAGADNDGTQRLDAYVVGTSAPADIAARLAASLPGYMLPSTWTRLTSIPRTPGGKLDRRSLPAPHRVSVPHRRATTDVERTVVTAVAEVLGIDEPGLDDNFVDLGGHSLSATRVLTRLRVATGSTLSVAQIFDRPTLGDLAALLDAAGTHAAETAADEPTALDVRPDPIPLSPAQRRLWFQSGIDDSAYTVPFAVELVGGTVDHDRLERSLQGVVARHEALRTRIVDGAQVIDAPGVTTVPIAEHDTPAADHLIADLVARPFDLTSDSPIRADLIRSGPELAVLLITVHHIAADEWSAGRLFDELAAGYNGVEVTAPPIQFADHTVWQLARLGDAADTTSLAARQLAHWRDVLANAPDELALPYDRPRGTDRDHRGAQVDRVLDAELLGTLGDHARAAGASMFMVVHTAVAVALSASGAGNDIVVGTPIAGRGAAAADTLIGMFVNTLALRTDLSANPTLDDVLAQVRRADLTAYEHADVPFDAVVTALAPERSLGRHPLFQTMVQYRDPIVAPAFEGLRATPVFPLTTTAKFDLTFEFAELEDRGGVRLRLEYATELFDAATAEALADRVIAVLHSLSRTPGTRLADLRFADDTAPAAPELRGGSRTLVDVFADTVAAHPDRTAVTWGATRLSYREIDTRSAHLAARLQSDGVGRGDFVALALPRSSDQVTAVLAVLRAGAAYVPIDPHYPQSRIDDILGDVAPRVIIDPDYLDAAFATPEFVATAYSEALSTDPAYVIFTSGSTGRPKGVVVSHANVVALLEHTAGLFDFRPDDVWTLFHSYAFDFSVWELWGPLSTGAALVVPDREVTRSPAEFAALVAAEGVTVLNQTPSAFFALDSVDTPAENLDLSSLRYVIFGGEALDLGRLQGFTARHPDITLVNMYGITEITVHASHLALTADDIAGATGSDIGALLPGFGGALLDQYLRPVPDGVTGELYLAGPQVAAGYLHRRGLTASRFVADPRGNGTLLYRTGDLFRRVAGRLLYDGRADAQVKIRGFRIELGEIRSAAASLDGVRDVAVITRPGPDGTPRILAYIVGDTDAAVDTDAIRVALTARLPEHMVPAAVVAVDRIPLTVNGKTDTAALPDPELRAGAGRRPSGELEIALADIFADSLGLPRDADGVPELAAEDDFFAIGGDSIVSTTMVNRARRRGLRITPRDVFTHRTVAGLATVAEWIDGVETPTGEVPAAETTAGRTPIALLPVVHRLREFGGAIDRFNQSLVVDTPAGLDHDRLGRALQSVLDSHAALRSRLTVVAGTVWTIEAEPVGAVAADDILETVAIDAHGTTFETITVESDRAAGRLAPTAGRMLAATYLEPAPGETGRLILVIHHLAVDGVSRRIILDDLAAADDALVAGTAVAALPEITSLPEFADAVTARAGDPALLGEAQHWAETLAPGGELVPGVPVRGGRVGDQQHHVVTLDTEITRALLTEIPAHLDVGVTSIFLGALRSAATSALGTADLVVDTERHGRDTDLAGLGATLDLSHTVGWFTTVAPLRLTPSPDLVTAIDAAERGWNEMPSAGAGFGMLRYLNPQLSAALAGLGSPSVLLNYLGRFTVGGGAPWQPAAESAALHATPDPDLGCGYPLEIDIVCRDEASGPVLSASFAYLPDSLDEDTVRRLAVAWHDAVTSLPAQIGVRP